MEWRGVARDYSARLRPGFRLRPAGYGGRVVGSRLPAAPLPSTPLPFDSLRSLPSTGSGSATGSSLRYDRTSGTGGRVQTNPAEAGRRGGGAPFAPPGVAQGKG